MIQWLLLNNHNAPHIRLICRYLQPHPRSSRTQTGNQAGKWPTAMYEHCSISRPYSAVRITSTLHLVDTSPAYMLKRQCSQKLAVQPLTMLALAPVTLRLGFGSVESLNLCNFQNRIIYTNCFSVIGVEVRSTIANLKFLTILISNCNTIRLQNQQLISNEQTS